MFLSVPITVIVPTCLEIISPFIGMIARKLKKTEVQLLLIVVAVNLELLYSDIVSDKFKFC